MSSEFVSQLYAVFANESVDDAQKRDLLREVIDKLLDAGMYKEAADVVSEVVFSDDPYIFEHIIDEWLRYDQLFLEALTCEMNYIQGDLPAAKLRDRPLFKRAATETKFAVRGVWFGLPDAAEKLLEVRDKYGLSSHFLAVVCKAAVQKELVSEVLFDMAKILGKYRVDREMLEAYARFFDSMNENAKVTRELSKARRQKWAKPCEMRHDVDADHKIAFIACVNDELYAKEAERYILRQRLPEGFLTQTVFVRDAKSMAEGYNRGMKMTDAKYKVYIHQDIFVCDPDFTMRLIKEFDETGCDMLGIAGTKKLPKTGIWWDAEGEDRQLCLWQDWILSTSGACNGVAGTAMEALDGVLIATVRDVPWRDDILGHFHFYDISQCLEFRRRGFKIGFFDNGGLPGVLHEVSVNHSEEYKSVYEAEREKFVAEYREELKCT